MNETWIIWILALQALFLAVGPPLFLLWTWRRWQSWQRLMVHAALMVPGIFVLSVAFFALENLAYYRFIQPAAMKGYPRCWFPDWFVISLGGLASVAAAAVFSLFWVPQIIAWRFLHPASFRVLTSRNPVRRPSALELDYAEPARRAQRLGSRRRRATAT